MIYCGPIIYSRDDYYCPQYTEKNLFKMKKLPKEYGVVYSGNHVYNIITKRAFIEKGLFDTSGDVFDELIDSQLPVSNTSLSCRNQV